MLYLCLKVISLGSLLIFLRQFFVLAVIIVYQPDVAGKTQIPFFDPTAAFWVITALHILALFFSLLGSLMTYLLKEEGRKFFLLGVFGLFLIQCLSFIPGLSVAGTTEPDLTLAMAQLGFYIFLTGLLLHPRSREYCQLHLARFEKKKESSS